MDLSENELIRYSRQLNLPEMGKEGQVRLKKASVLVIGCGGLGIPVLQYLCAAGIGKIGIADGDRVEVSNLHRQVIFKESDLGKLKIECAEVYLRNRNSKILIEGIPEFLNSQNALRILGDYDIIVDATDNIPSRYLINDACIILSKTFVYASVYRFEGQVSVFNYLNDEERGINYRDLFPLPPKPESIPNCEEGGVLGLLPGVIGLFQASEVIKHILGIPSELKGKLLLYDALEMSFRKVKIQKDLNQKVLNELIDYETFCNSGAEDEKNKHEINSSNLLEMIKSQKDFQLLDVRNEHEHKFGNIGGINIPLENFNTRIIDFKPDRIIVCYCRSGQRSVKAIEMLKKYLPEDRLFHLKGGILTWQKEQDPFLQVL